MSDSKLLGCIVIKEIKYNSDGTCTLELEVPDDLTENLKQSLGSKRWSSKKFNESLLEALTKHAKDMERESGNIAPNDQHRFDVFDSESIQRNCR